MKLSLSWLFSHCKKNPFLEFQSEFEKGNFFERISSTVAEIEHIQKVTYPLETIFCATVTHSDGACTVTVPELNSQIVLPARTDLEVGDRCLISKQGDTFAYLSLRDLYAEKEGFVPPVWITDKEQDGAWKKNLPSFDYILTFDNKALTHRPDLWGHRGFAREVAALYNLELLPDEYLSAQKAVRSFTQCTPAVAGNMVGLENEYAKTGAPNSQLPCTRIAGLSITSIDSVGSFPDMLFRLCAIDAKPINGIVDTTNYVMYDIGQPMHAFDAAHLVNVVTIRPARDGEKLILLDGTPVTLQAGTMVTADAEKVLSISGVMGGKDSAVTKKTTALFIESGAYAPSTIRTASQTYKVRTESSTRYEKSLDPLYNTQAITRFLHLLDMHDVRYQSAQALMSLGQVPPEKTIRVTQAFISDRIGTPVSADHIHTILHALGFGIQQKTLPVGQEFMVTVPSFRATKDVTIPEDIVEEVARFIGFNNLALQLPSRVMKPFSLDYRMNVRALKRLCAFGFTMHEVSNYALYDNQFLEKIGLRTRLSAPAYELANPVSEHWTDLVSSLIPHFLKNIEQNVHEHDRMSFFEINTIWKRLHDKPVEQVVCAGIWYQAPEINFYEYKEKVNQLCTMLQVAVIWRTPLAELPAWCHPYQTAELVYHDTVIGYAGFVRPEILQACAPGHAFIFEIELDALLRAPQAEIQFVPLPSYQPVTTDISLRVPFSVSVDALEQLIAHADARIYLVQLVDYFENPAWAAERAVTLRYKAVDQEKTFSKHEIDQLRATVINAVQKAGVTIR